MIPFLSTAPWKLPFPLVAFTRRFSLALSPNTCSIASRSPLCLSCGQLRFRRNPYPTPATSLEIPFIFPVFTSASRSSISTHSNHWWRSTFVFFRCWKAAKRPWISLIWGSLDVASWWQRTRRCFLCSMATSFRPIKVRESSRGRHSTEGSARTTSPLHFLRYSV